MIDETHLNLPMQRNNYIPKHKHDIPAVECLERLSFEVIKNDVPLLLEWLQDGNWPVAEGVAEYLTPHINEISRELMVVLNSDDGMWKYWIICGLLVQFPKKLDLMLIDAVRRIAEHPTSIEIADEVNEVAKDLIETKRLYG